MKATRAAALAVVAVAAAACSGAPSPHRTSAAPTVTTPATSPSRPADACPSTYAAPDPHRPRTALRFVMAGDHASVTGHERIAFTPDRTITELVFRLTANSPTPDTADHPSTTVTAATADHGGGRFTVTRAGAQAGTQGGLLHIPFAHPVPAGTIVTADLDFTLHLGTVGSGPSRFGVTQGYGYFGSGAPLLAWQRGYGWHTENMVGFPAETATSEAAALDLTVVAPAGDTVIASGDPTPSAAVGGTRTWRATLPAARDASVAVGPFADVSTRVGGVVLHLGATSAAERDRLVPQFRRAITELARRFGPFPFPSLSVARLPAGGGGIEYPSSILMLDDSRTVAVHETAHQWFYALVGDSQALHPWLDEAFAEYAEELVDRVPSHASDLGGRTPVDRPIAAYGSDEDGYYATTYGKGSAALEAARSAAGGVAFDRALRCYVAAHAWSIAVPSDLARSLASLPAALTVLRRAGALR